MLSVNIFNAVREHVTLREVIKDCANSVLGSKHIRAAMIYN